MRRASFGFMAVLLREISPAGAATSDSRGQAGEWILSLPERAARREEPESP